MASASKWHFTEDEIRAKLAELGYNNLPDKALNEFSKDLHKLIAEETSDQSHIARDPSSSSLTSSTLSSPTNTTISSEPTEYSPEYDTRHQAAAPGYRVTFQHNAKTEQNLTRYSDNDEPQTSHAPFFRSNTYQYIAPEKENTVVKTANTSLRLAQKRKVLRHKDGIAKIFDESFTNDSSDISVMEERLQHLPLKDKSGDNTNSSVYSDQSDESTAWSTGRDRNALPSFIRPKSCDPSNRGTCVRKTDPVNRYHQFNQEWSSKKVPSEKVHKNLRWSTREQMLQYETFERPRHNYIPNKYVAPTEKKRQALRWQVRSALANT